MKVIVAGSREITDPSVVAKAIQDSGFEVTELVSGGARGIDALGERWADERNINVSVFLADWNTYGLAAGPIRNTRMAEYAEALVAIWDGRSKGTKDMIEKAQRRGLKVYVHNYSMFVG